MYHPSLKVTLVSADEICEAGGVVHLEKSKRFLVDKTGVSHPVRKVGKLPAVEIQFDTAKELECEICAVGNVASTSATKQLQHERNAHFAVQGVNVGCCPGCALGKNLSVSHKKTRPAYLLPIKFLQQVDADFIGKFIASINGNFWVLTIIDTFTNWVENYPCKTRDECGAKLERFFREVGVPESVRSDNAQEFKGAKSAWVSCCARYKVAVQNSVVYEPQTNGKVERFNRTQKDAIRAVLHGVDPKLWDYAAVFVAHVWNRVQRKKEIDCPYKKRYDRTPKTSYFRKFGVLCYAKIHVQTGGSAFSSKFERGVFLGYSKNSCYLVGHWRYDGRSHGEKFVVTENRTVKFDETITIGDVEDLKRCKRGTFVPFSLPESLGDSSVVLDEGVAPVERHELDSVAPLVSDPVRSQEDSNTVVPMEICPGPDAPAVDAELDGDQRVSPVIRDDPDSPESDSRVVGNPNGVLKKKRGRPKGTKAKPHWRKPGPKPKVAQANLADVVFGTEDDVDRSLFKRRNYSETAVSYTISVSRKEAFEGPDAIKWLEADSLERCQLEALKCWRPIEPGEIGEADEVIPSVMIYTRKRDGRYKARLVALGNKQKNVGSSEIFSPTISHAANRYLLIEAAARGHFLEQFDISTAFIKAVLGDERVFVRLPKHWSTEDGKGKGQIVRLLRSLYGLKISPRKWYDTFKDFLVKRGWEECPREPGLFRKFEGTPDEMTLSIYVDDGLMGGANPDVLRAERDAICAGLGGKVIPAVLEGSTEVRDILGVSLRYNRVERSVKFDVSKPIDKLLGKFNMSDCRTVVSPVVNDCNLEDGKPRSDFPIRQLVGSLMYLATICRPDIAFAVQRLARFVDKPTENVVRAAKRVLAYLKGTKDSGLEYTPEIESSFWKVYSEVAKKGERELPSTVAFTDSDFAGCTVTLRSTTGSILYHRGCPIARSAKRQSILAHSTCEAEYVALYDAIRMCENQGYLHWYIQDDKLPLVFCDNQSALSLAKSSVVTKRSKHMDLRFHKVREHFKDLCYVPTNLNKADPLTKPLVGSKYIDLFKPTAIHEKVLDESERPSWGQAFFVCPI